MPDYKRMYCVLFNQVSKTIEQLQKAQRETEEMYVNSDETPMAIVKEDNSNFYMK